MVGERAGMVKFWAARHRVEVVKPRAIADREATARAVALHAVEREAIALLD
jgi:hypothetical protein